MNNIYFVFIALFASFGLSTSVIGMQKEISDVPQTKQETNANFSVSGAKWGRSPDGRAIIMTDRQGRTIIFNLDKHEHAPVEQNEVARIGALLDLLATTKNPIYSPIIETEERTGRQTEIQSTQKPENMEEVD